MMRIGYVQNAPVFGAREENFEEVRTLLKGVNTDLIVLPELFATGYAFTTREEARNLAETGQGQTAGFLKEISTRTGSTVVGGFIEAADDGIYNSLLIVAGDEVIDTYRKIHLFNREKLWFTPGNKPLRVYDIRGVKIGAMICFDWIFPEVCRTLALQGMQVLAHPSNLIMPYCQDAMVTRCIENRIFAVTANRIGSEKRGEDHFTFTGASRITGIDGRVLSSGPVNRTHVSVVEVDEKLALNKEVNAFNDLLKDRRPDFYDPTKKTTRS